MPASKGRRDNACYVIQATFDLYNRGFEFPQLALASDEMPLEVFSAARVCVFSGDIGRRVLHTLRNLPFNALCLKTLLPLSITIVLQFVVS